MKTIALPPGAGKTQRLIEMSAESGNYIVCHSENEASRIQQQAIRSGCDINFPMTYDEWIKHSRRGLNISGYLIDNIDLLVAHISRGIPVNAITLTT